MIVPNAFALTIFRKAASPITGSIEARYDLDSFINGNIGSTIPTRSLLIIRRNCSINRARRPSQEISINHR